LTESDIIRASQAAGPIKDFGNKPERTDRWTEVASSVIGHELNGRKLVSKYMIYIATKS